MPYFNNLHAVVMAFERKLRLWMECSLFNCVMVWQARRKLHTQYCLEEEACEEISY